MEMSMKLPNGLSIILGAALVAALTAIAGELPETAQGWIPLAGAAIIGGIAKAVQVWMDAQRYTTMGGSKWRTWLTG